MAYRDLRDFINFLEKEGELWRIPLEVDWRYELAGWIRKTCDLRPPGPALLFEKLSRYSSDYRIASGLIGSYQRFAMVLGLPSDTSPWEIANVFRERIKTPLEPVMVNDGPSQENVDLGENIDLLKSAH